MSKWRGYCTACRKDLYSDPGRHYITDSHINKAKRLDKAEDEDPRLVKMFGNVKLLTGERYQ